MSFFSWLFGTGRKEKDSFGDRRSQGRQAYDPTPYSPPAPYEPTPYSSPSSDPQPEKKVVEKPASREKKVARELGINIHEVMAAVNYQPVVISTNVYSLAEAVKKFKQAEELEDEKNKKILIVKIDELAQAELYSADDFQKVAALYELLSQESKTLSAVTKKWISCATTKDEIQEIVNSLPGESPEKEIALGKLISLVDDFDEAREVFQGTEKDTPEETAAMVKWLSFVSDIDQAIEAFEATGDDSEAQKLAFDKCLSFVSSLDEAEDMFNRTSDEMAKAAFEKWLSLANTAEEIENIYNSVSDSFEEMASAKLQKVIISQLPAASSFEEVEGIHDGLLNGSPDELYRAVIRRLIALATSKEQMEQIHTMAGNDSDDLQAELEEEIVVKWLLLVTEIEDVKEVYDAAVTKQAEKMAKDRLRELFSAKLAAADTFEEAEEAYDNCPDEEGLERIAIERMILLASSIGQMVRIETMVSDNDLGGEFDKIAFEKCFSLAQSLSDIEEMHDDFPLSDEEEKLVIKRWISLAQTMEDMNNIPLDDLSERDDVYKEAQKKKDQFYLAALSSADKIYQIQEIVSGTSDESVARKAGQEKWFSLISNVEEAEELLDGVQGEEMETTAVKKWLSFSHDIGDFGQVYDRSLNSESKDLIMTKWTESALEVLRRISSIKEARELLPYFPESGEARRELIKKAYSLVG